LKYFRGIGAHSLCAAAATRTNGPWLMDAVGEFAAGLAGRFAIAGVPVRTPAVLIQIANRRAVIKSPPSAALFHQVASRGIVRLHTFAIAYIMATSGLRGNAFLLSSLTVA
jgi:hypothetical protein